MNLFEKLNRIDDSLVESKRVVKKKKLTESVEDVGRKEDFLKEVFTKQEIIELAEAHTDFTGKTYKEAFKYVLNNWDNFYFEDDYEAFCEDELDDDIDEMLTEASEKTIYRAEYFEPKVGNWIQYYSGNDINKVKQYIDTPIIGNPKRRVAEYKVTGVRKPKYTFVKELDLK